MNLRRAFATACIAFGLITPALALLLAATADREAPKPPPARVANGPAVQAAPSPPPAKVVIADAPYALQLLSPGPTGIATDNQLTQPRAFTAAISDDAMRVKAGPVRFTGVAQGLRNVAIVFGGAWTTTEPEPSGRFGATISLAGQPRGPLVIDVYAWDTPPDIHTFKAAVNLRVHLFVEDGADASAPIARAAGHPAHGRALAWRETFDTLSPTVWHAGPKPDGQEYGAAVFAGYDHPGHDPYTIMDGFLRIRAKHTPGLDDPKGWGRAWTTGHLSTGFPDGSASASFRTGYFEARMLLPTGPGTWSSFWMLDQDSIKAGEEQGAVEIDVIEGYGHSPTSYVATEHDWPAPKDIAGKHRRATRNIADLPDLALAFHDYGVEITDTEVAFYFDGVEKFRAPLNRAATVSPFFMLATLAMSHDWPITVPPSGYYDLWIDEIRVYR